MTEHLVQRLDRHPVYEAVRSLEDLRVFMSYHVYSVWDFMSLVKSLQASIAPAGAPWMPVGDTTARRFINEVVLEEESDTTPVAGQYASHFELYLEAMREIGEEGDAVRGFLRSVQARGIDGALSAGGIPEASADFMRVTFDILHEGKPHCVAAAFALGRERVIPLMFDRILGALRLPADQAPTFRYYLERHIHLDGDSHGPMALHLLDVLCGGDEQKTAEAMVVAERAVAAREALWDAVLLHLQGGEGLRAAS